MGDIIPNDAAYPHWRQLCLAAVSELDAEKLPQRLADARSAVLDRIEDRFSQPLDGEQTALRDALEMPRMLRTIAEREIGEQKTGT